MYFIIIKLLCHVRVYDQFHDQSVLYVIGHVGSVIKINV